MNAGLMPMTAVPSKVTSVGMSNKAPATIIVVNHLRRVSSLEVVHPSLILHGELRCAERGILGTGAHPAAVGVRRAESKAHARINRASKHRLDSIMWSERYRGWFGAARHHPRDADREQVRRDNITTAAATRPYGGARARLTSALEHRYGCSARRDARRGRGK